MVKRKLTSKRKVRRKNKKTRIRLSRRSVSKMYGGASRTPRRRLSRLQRTRREGPVKRQVPKPITTVVFDFDCTLSENHLWKTTHRYTKQPHETKDWGQIATDAGFPGQTKKLINNPLFVEWIMGGSQRIQQLRDFLTHLQRCDVRLEISTLSEVDRVYHVLRQVGLIRFFSRIHGRHSSGTGTVVWKHPDKITKVQFLTGVLNHLIYKRNWVHKIAKDTGGPVIFIDDSPKNYGGINRSIVSVFSHPTFKKDGSGLTQEHFRIISRFACPPSSRAASAAAPPAAAAPPVSPLPTPKRLTRAEIFSAPVNMIPENELRQMRKRMLARDLARRENKQAQRRRNNARSKQNDVWDMAESMRLRTPLLIRKEEENNARLRYFDEPPYPMEIKGIKPIPHSNPFVGVNTPPLGADDPTGLDPSNPFAARVTRPNVGDAPTGLDPSNPFAASVNDTSDATVLNTLPPPPVVSDNGNQFPDIKNLPPPPPVDNTLVPMEKFSFPPPPPPIVNNFSSPYVSNNDMPNIGAFNLPPVPTNTVPTASETASETPIAPKLVAMASSGGKYTKRRRRTRQQNRRRVRRRTRRRNRRRVRRRTRKNK